MTPVIRSADALRVRSDIHKIINDIQNAPAAAEMLSAMPVPAVQSVAMATPVPAPALIPRMCGSARGFMNTACMTDPDMASPMPARIAVRSLGSRKLLTIAAIRLSAVPVNA